MLKTPQKKCQTQKKLTKSRKKSPDSCIYHFFFVLLYAYCKLHKCGR